MWRGRDMQRLTDEMGAESSNTCSADVGWWCRRGEICFPLSVHRDHQEKATTNILRVTKLYGSHTQEASSSLDPAILRLFYQDKVK